MAQPRQRQEQEELRASIPLGLSSDKRPLPIEDAKQRGAAKQYQHLVTVAQLRARLRRVEAEIYSEEWAENRRKLGYDPNYEADIILKNLDDDEGAIA